MEKVLIQGFAVNKSKITRENIDGKGIIILNNVLACRSDSVMNGLYYPASFVVNNFESLEGTLAPIGHPKSKNGELLPSTDAQAINEYHGGAWNKNARINKNGSVYLDIHIDEGYAKNSEKGRELLERIKDVEEGKTDHLWTSTGLYYESDGVAGTTKEGVKFHGSIIGGKFEHNAILLNELPAGGDTGFTVNNLNESHDLRKPKNKLLAFFGITGNDINKDELNKEISDKLEDLYNGEAVLTHIYNDYFVYHKDNDILKRSYKITDQGAELGEPETVSANFEKSTANKEGEEGNMTEEQIKAILADTMASIEAKITGQIEALKAETEELKAAVKETADTALNEQREAVKNQYDLSDEAVNALAGNALQELYSKTQTGARILGGNAEQEESDLYVDFNALIEGGK